MVEQFPRKRVIMLTLATLAVFVFMVIPAIAWVLGLTFKVIGWTMRMVFGVLLLPLWIVLFLLGGLALAAQIVIPIGLIVFVISLFVPET